MAKMRYGAVIVFNKDTTREEAERIIDDLARTAKLPHLPHVEAYDPDYGAPVFYIP